MHSGQETVATFDVLIVSMELKLATGEESKCFNGSLKVVSDGQFICQLSLFKQKKKKSDGKTNIQRYFWTELATELKLT